MAVSLAASLFSISNKYTWLDKDGVEDEAADPKCKAKCPCINGWYVVRIVWRFAFVATRFCILSLIWSVLGGAFLGIFLAVSFCVWWTSLLPTVLEEFGADEWYWIILVPFMWGTSSLISTPASEKLAFAVLHGLEMVTALTVITVFAYNEFDCGICADSGSRQAANNPYIRLFIISGWSTMAIDFIGYGILLFSGMFKDGSWEKSFGVFFDGLEEIENKHKTKLAAKFKAQKNKVEDPAQMRAQVVTN